MIPKSISARAVPPSSPMPVPQSVTEVRHVLQSSVRASAETPARCFICESEGEWEKRGNERDGEREREREGERD